MAFAFMLPKLRRRMRETVLAFKWYRVYGIGGLRKPMPGAEKNRSAIQYRLQDWKYRKVPF